MLKIELLESRVTPASYFVHGNELAIENSGGTSVNLGPDVGLVGANGVVLLRAGDRLIFDNNGNNVFEPIADRDRELVRVTAGQAKVFLRDFNGDLTYEPDELSGLAVSNGFRGVVSTDIRGDVATVLEPNGDLALGGGVAAIQFASIAGLTVAGRVTGDVLAGNRISNLNIGSGLYQPAGPSVTSVTTGSATDGVGVSFGLLFFAADFTQPDADAGGNISNVQLASGARSVVAGSGGDNTDGTGGAGGNISGLKMGAAFDGIIVQAGQGGDGTGKGGRGGSISGSTIRAMLAGGVLNDATVRAGDGGDVTPAGGGNGGKGGSISNTRLIAEGAGDSVMVEVGAGGRARGSGRASGAGGVMSNVTVSAADLSGNLHVFGGAGGDAADTAAAGGIGGGISRVSVQAGVVGGELAVESGDGGDGTSGAAGGPVRSLTIAAGSVSENVFVFGGRGGTASAGRGGAGGSLSAIDSTFGTVSGGLASRLYIFAGDAGHSNNAPGAAGGSTSGVHVTNTGFVGSALGLTIDAGRGGIIDDGNGAGGAGGNLSNVTVTNFGGLGALSIEGGPGASGHGVGSGGKGGGISNVTVNSFAAIGGTATVGAGNGGRSGETAGNGASGGAVDRVTVHDNLGEAFEISGGNPGGSNPGRSGDRGGDRNIVLDGFNSDFRVFGGGLGVPATLNPLGGGLGGSVSNVSGVVGRLVVRAGDGLPSAGGPGGAGGSISNVNVTGVREFVRSLMAGNGGNGGTTGGNGGSISNVRVAGDIGDFTSVFAMDASGAAGQGGIAVGQHGTGAVNGLNGMVTNVRADGIATIIAGRPAANAITAANAVRAISNVDAFVVGADLNHNGALDLLIDAPLPGFHLGDGDTVIDGLIVVRTGGLSAIHNPLTGDLIRPLFVAEATP